MPPEPPIATIPYTPTGRVDIDGRAIYTKTIDLGAMPNATVGLYAHGIPIAGPAALLKVVNQFGSAVRYSTAALDQVPLPYPHAQGAPIGCSCTVDTGVGYVRIDTGSTNYSAFVGQYTLEFTTLAG